MAKRPTVYDVAERAGVSIATVSFTFRQPERVKQSTRDSVLVAAGALGYVPSASARGLAKGRTGALGLFSFDYLRSEQADGTPIVGGHRGRATVAVSKWYGVAMRTISASSRCTWTRFSAVSSWSAGVAGTP